VAVNAILATHVLRPVRERAFRVGQVPGPQLARPTTSTGSRISAGPLSWRSAAAVGKPLARAAVVMASGWPSSETTRPPPSRRSNRWVGEARAQCPSSEPTKQVGLNASGRLTKHRMRMPHWTGGMGWRNEDGVGPLGMALLSSACCSSTSSGFSGTAWVRAQPNPAPPDGPRCALRRRLGSGRSWSSPPGAVCARLRAWIASIQFPLARSACVCPSPVVSHGPAAPNASEDIRWPMCP